MVSPCQSIGSTGNSERPDRRSRPHPEASSFMSIDGIFVVDSVVHGFDTTAANAVGRFGRGVLLSNFGFQWAMVPDPYRVEPLRYFQTTSADVLEALLFHESGVDLAVYHTVPAWGFFRDFSPMSVGIELRRRHPKRVLL